MKHARFVFLTLAAIAAFVAHAKWGVYPDGFHDGI